MTESTNTKIRKHFTEHKEVYLIIGTLIIGIALGKVIFGRGPSFNIPINNAPVINVPVMSNNTSFGGHAHKLVKCLETNQIWETVADAANAAGANQSAMSKHLNGHRDHLYGLHYAIIGLGAGV